jgi:Tfp pilus assembly protein FimT
VEILVVVLVLALAVGIAVVNLRLIQQRAVLQSESEELASFLRSVPSEARELHGLVFLHWDADSRRLSITDDAVSTHLLASYQVSDLVSVSTAMPALLRCDTMSRAYIGDSSSMMTTIQTIDLEHVRNLGPRVSYRLVLSPLWSVVTEKRVE